MRDPVCVFIEVYYNARADHDMYVLKETAAKSDILWELWIKNDYEDFEYT